MQKRIPKEASPSGGWLDSDTESTEKLILRDYKGGLFFRYVEKEYINTSKGRHKNPRTSRFFASHQSVTNRGLRRALHAIDMELEWGPLASRVEGRSKSEAFCLWESVFWEAFFVVDWEAIVFGKVFMCLFGPWSFGLRKTIPMGTEAPSNASFVGVPFSHSENQNNSPTLSGRIGKVKIGSLVWVNDWTNHQRKAPCLGAEATSFFQINDECTTC